MPIKFLSIFLIVILCLGVCLMDAQATVFNSLEGSSFDTETAEEEMLGSIIFSHSALLPTDYLIAGNSKKNIGPSIAPLIGPPKISA